MVDLNDFADAVRDEETRVMRENRRLRSAIANAERANADLRQRLGLFESLDSEPIEAPEWLVTPSRDEKVGIPSLLVTDVHYDEVVDLEQTGGINKYNREIADLRLERAFTRAVKLSRDYLSGVRYDGFNLMLGGDMVSGVIHEELKETNQAEIMDTVVSMVEPLVAGVHLLQEQFGKVHVSGVVGNHGRNTRKPRSKNRVTDNFDWLVYRLLMRETERLPGVSFNVPKSADALIQVYDTRYLLTHGDQFRGGSGISGIFTPLRLGAARKNEVYSYRGEPYDVMVFGHFHQALPVPSLGLIGGGSLVGYSEYSAVNNFRPEPPRCEFWVTTPEHGPTFHAPVFVQNREREGW